jgi:Helix-turn-helix of insertion element transposase
MQENATLQAELGEGLSATQERAILALLSQPTTRKAASTVGVDEATLWRWLQDKEFHSSYMKARRETVSRSIARLQQCTTEAVNTLRSVMSDKESPASARVMAAKATLDYALKAVELEDLAGRVADLEATLNQKSEESTK